MLKTITCPNDMAIVYFLNNDNDFSKIFIKTFKMVVGKLKPGNIVMNVATKDRSVQPRVYVCPVNSRGSKPVEIPIDKDLFRNLIRYLDPGFVAEWTQQYKDTQLVYKTSVYGGIKGSNRKSHKSARFGVISPSDYKMYRDMKKKGLHTHLKDACINCDEEKEIYYRAKRNGNTFKPVRMNWMRENCNDCARLTCNIYKGLKSLGISKSNIGNAKEDCMKRLRIAEKLS